MNLFSSTIKKNILLVFKGIAMGAANKVPGVSGGVVAFVAGFYEELIYSLQKINLKAFSILVNRGWKPFVQYINGRFLGLLFLGVGISYFSFCCCTSDIFLLYNVSIVILSVLIY